MPIAGCAAANNAMQVERGERKRIRSEDNKIESKRVQDNSVRKEMDNGVEDGELMQM